MLIKVAKENLNFFEALASDIRLNIIGILAEGELNIKELAEKNGVSSSIMTKHIKKLESAGIILCRQVSKDGSSHKLCGLLDAEYWLQLPIRSQPTRDMYEVSMPVGQYTDIEMHPTCGMASAQSIIGRLDDPRIAYDPERCSAELLWMTRGFVEYTFPNYMTREQQPEEIEISFEIGSEAPGFNDVWPSEIGFSLAGVHLFAWTSPGDFGSRRGILTPSWWNPNQYGLLKTIRINAKGTFLDDIPCSPLTINGLPLNSKGIKLRMEVKETKGEARGLTLFGEKFGDYPQDILMRVFCRQTIDKPDGRYSGQTEKPAERSLHHGQHKSQPDY